ncbi:HesA/MoeB/ThiF family protein [Pseudomonas sp. TE3610]
MIKISASILDDLGDDGCVMEVVAGWGVEYSDRSLWIHDEKGTSVEFKMESDEYWIIRDAGEAKQITARYNRETGKRYQLSSLANLWQLGVIRSSEDLELPGQSHPPSRFRWQDEYFRKFANSKMPVRLMNSNLDASVVTIIGVGGLGSMIAMLLAAAGVGTLRLIDGDTVGEDNLPRQILYPENSIGRSKVSVLAETLQAHNSQTQVQVVPEFVSGAKQAQSLTAGSNFIVLCADQPRLEIRAWIGQASIFNRIPFMAMANNWIGPISVPFVSSCYLCQAKTYRSRYADAASFVKKITVDPLPARAAFGPGPTIIAGFMSSAILHFLAGHGEDDLLFNSFSVSRLGHLERMEYPRYRGCAVCGNVKNNETTSA